MKKRLLAILATAAMVVAMIPSMVFAASEYNVANKGLEETFAAINASTETEVTVNVSGTVTWTTGASHGSTPLVTADSKAKTVTIDGGNSATLEAIGQGVGSLRAANGGTLVFKNLTIKDSSVSYAEENWELCYLEFGGKLVFENCNFENAIQLNSDNGSSPEVNAEFINCKFNSNKDNEYAVWVGHGEVSFEGCTFTGPRGVKIHEAYGSEVDVVSVENCVFDSLSKKPGIAIGDLNADTTVSVKDSAVAGCQPGDQQKYIYESDTNVDSFELILDNNEIGDYVITYDLAGGTVSKANPKTYDAETNVTLNNPTREGYKFLGWTGSNGNEPQTEVVVNGAGTTGGLEYVANWEAIPVAEKPDASPNTGDNNMAPFAVAGLALAAMAAVVATRRRTN